VQIAGFGPEISFSQELLADELMINLDTGASDTQLLDFARTIAAAENGTITITVSNLNAEAESALGGLAIREGTRGSLHGQKWNDVNGDGIQNGGEQGLEGWTIFIDENGNGQLDANATFEFDAPEVPQNIPDKAFIKSEIEIQGVAALKVINDINVTFDISHTFNADINVWLTSPSGTKVRLVDDVGGNSDNFTNTTFDDAALTSILNVTPVMAPFTGSFRPEEPLSFFNGQDANGIWTLTIQDDQSNDIGVLNSWSLTIAGSEIFTITDGLGNYDFPGLSPGIYNIAEVEQEGWTQTFAPPPVTVTSGAFVSGVNFGNQEGIGEPDPGSISGVKWNDLDGDGERDEGEPGLGEVRIYLDSNDNGVLDEDAIPTTIANNVPQAIADGATVISAIEVSGLASIQDVDVNLSIEHSFDNDLDVFLISPSGTQVQLFTGVGGQFNDFTNTTFDDDAAIAIDDDNNSFAPFTGSFRPEGLLSDLNGENPNGTWQLLIRDTVPADTGTLLNWSLTLVGTELSTTTDSNGEYSFDTLPPGRYFVREVLQSPWVQTSAPDTITDAFGDQYNAVVTSNNDFTADFGNRIGAPALPGDHNRDGFVDAGDYVMFRKLLGSSVPNPYDGADSSGNGIVDADDFGVFRRHMGESLGGGGLATSGESAQTSAGSSYEFASATTVPDSSVANAQIASLPSTLDAVFSLVSGPLDVAETTLDKIEAPSSTVGNSHQAFVALLKTLDAGGDDLGDDLDLMSSFGDRLVEDVAELAEDCGQEVADIDALFELIGA
jgi:subtilisin-like proprotein convertase family protein